MYLRERKELNNKIRKVNEVRKVINKAVPLVMAELEPFVGQKIIKADEQLVKKFSDKIEFLVDMRDKLKVKPLDGEKHASCHVLYVTATRYSVMLKLSACFSTGSHGCNYEDDTIYIGDVKNSLMGKAGDGTLEKVKEFKPLPMLSASKEWAKYVKACKAKEALEQATNAMFHGLRDWVR